MIGVHAMHADTYLLHFEWEYYYSTLESLGLAVMISGSILLHPAAWNQCQDEDIN